MDECKECAPQTAECEDRVQQEVCQDREFDISSSGAFARMFLQKNIARIAKAVKWTVSIPCHFFKVMSLSLMS